MREPDYSEDRFARAVEIQDFYFNLNDEKSPIITPIMFYNCTEEKAFVKYNPTFRAYHHKTYKFMMERFIGNEVILEKYRIKDLIFFAGEGCLFRAEKTLEEIWSFFPIIISAFDENTNWLQKEGFKIVVSTEELNHLHNIKIKPKLLRFIEEYSTTHKSDIIWTNDVKKWCFNPKPNLKFKSIKEQREFLVKLEELVLVEV